jgi:hypothetical protein
MSWSSGLTMAPSYPPPGAGTDYPSPTASRRASECFSDMSNSRRGSLAGFASELESTGQWQSVGSESKGPLAQFGFLKNLTEKKTTRGLQLQHNTLGAILMEAQMVNRQREGAPSPTASLL